MVEGEQGGKQQAATTIQGGRTQAAIQGCDNSNRVAYLLTLNLCGCVAGLAEMNEKQLADPHSRHAHSQPASQPTSNGTRLFFFSCLTSSLGAGLHPCPWPHLPERAFACVGPCFAFGISRPQKATSLLQTGRACLQVTYTLMPATECSLQNRQCSSNMAHQHESPFPWYHSRSNQIYFAASFLLPEQRRALAFGAYPMQSISVAPDQPILRYCNCLLLFTNACVLTSVAFLSVRSDKKGGRHTRNVMYRGSWDSSQSDARVSRNGRPRWRTWW